MKLNKWAYSHKRQCLTFSTISGWFYHTITLCCHLGRCENNVYTLLHMAVVRIDSSSSFCRIPFCQISICWILNRRNPTPILLTLTLCNLGFAKLKFGELEEKHYAVLLVWWWLRIFIVVDSVCPLDRQSQRQKNNRLLG